MSLTTIAEAVVAKRRDWLQSESNDGDFTCTVYVSEDHWRSMMQLGEGRTVELSASFYHEQKILGYPVYVAYAKGREDHPPFYICVTS